MLVTLTLVLVAVVVLGLASHLIAVAWALTDARRSVTRIADALERVAGQTEPLERKLVTINGALGALDGGLDAARLHVTRIARVFKL